MLDMGLSQYTAQLPSLLSTQTFSGVGEHVVQLLTLMSPFCVLL